MGTQNNNQNNIDIGSRIQESVLDALRTGDFSKLNVEITDSVRDVLNGVGDTINSAVSEAKAGVIPNSPINNSSQARGFTTNTYPYRDTAQMDIARHIQQRQELIKKPKPRVRFQAKGLATGIIQLCFFWLPFIFGLGSFLNAYWFLGIIFSICGIAMLIRGTMKIALYEQAKKFKEMCSDNLYASIETLALSMGLSKSKTVKIAKKILKAGFFPEGFMDEEETTFMVSKKIYEQYLRTQEHRKILEEEEAKVKESGNLTNTEKTELDVMITKGLQYTNRLHELNDEIPGEVISLKLSRLEELLVEIFTRVKEHPDQMKNCSKLMEYYLPTMIKLVEAYAEYDKVSQPGEDILAAKSEIEKTLDIINQAFVELLNKLFQSSVWDVTAEAKVLTTMLHQEGLTDGTIPVTHEDKLSQMGQFFEEEEEEVFTPAQEQVEVPVVKEV